MAFPSCEDDVIQLFKLICPRTGWEIIHLQTAFPDAVVKNDKGDELTCEFEFLSGNYKCHQHPINGCQLIICWHDNWSDCPLPVMALESCAKKEAEIIEEIMGHYVSYRYFLGSIRSIWIRLERLLSGKSSLDDLVQHGPLGVNREYEWGYEFLMNKPRGWDWTVAMAIPPGWGLVPDEEGV